LKPVWVRWFFRFTLPLIVILAILCPAFYYQEKALLDSLNKAIPRVDASRRLWDLKWKLLGGSLLLIGFSSVAGPLFLAASESYKDMAQRLDRIFHSQRRFLADASHELRTPLTVMRGEMEVLLNNKRTADEYREQIQSTLEEVDRLTRLVNDLLTLAEIDSGQWIIKVETVDLRDLCREVLEKLQSIAREKGVNFLYKEGPQVHVSGDRTALERVVLNLADNAIRYTPRGKSVFMESSHHGACGQLVVRDEGAGIPAEDLPHIFDRFYRVDKARATEQGGTGLGLAIVKEIVESHKGKIDVKSEVGRGTTFTIRLPAW